MPLSETDLLALLDARGIPFSRHAHPPLFTVEESRRLRGDLAGAHVKNMFLKDRKGALVLVTCREDRRIRIGALERALGTKRLSFAGAETLMAHLGVLPGAVTPFALLNDREPPRVRFVLDAVLAEADPVNVHPLHNAATLALRAADLLRLLAETGHAAELLDFAPLEAAAP
jgi:Ala-tRNA(Pro) deacylase